METVGHRFGMLVEIRDCRQSVGLLKNVKKIAILLKIPVANNIQEINIKSKTITVTMTFSEKGTRGDCSSHFRRHDW
jgi:hypothetical protein